MKEQRGFCENGLCCSGRSNRTEDKILWLMLVLLLQSIEQRVAYFYSKSKSLSQAICSAIADIWGFTNSWFSQTYTGMADLIYHHTTKLQTPDETRKVTVWKYIWDHCPFLFLYFTSWRENTKAISYHRNYKRESIFSSPLLPIPDQSLCLLTEQKGIKIRFECDGGLDGKRRFLKQLSLLEI